MQMLKQIATLFWVQVKLQFKIRLRYMNATITELIIYAGAFLIILFGSNSSELGKQYGTKEGILITMIGYLFWGIGISALGSCSNKVESDELSGIFETEAQSIFPLWLIYLIQTIVENIFVWIYLLLIGIIASFFADFTFGQLLSVFLLSFVFSFISNIGMFGIGMIFASGSIRFKRMGQWATVLQALLVMVSNVYLPVFSVFQEVIPYVGGVEMVRKLFLGRSVSGISFLIYVVVNLVWLLIGIFIFNYCIEKERKTGSFDAF